jgi:hypothetical protein
MSRTSRVLLAGATVALAAGLVPTVGAMADAPLGNNGTVKIDGRPFDTAPDNEPHVGCRFDVDWYGFDDDAVSNVEFALQPPTGTQVLLTDSVPLNMGDNVDNEGGGSEAGWDASRMYNLGPAINAAGVKAHPIQGYHVKLTINTQPTAQGADVKHKVFWVTDCQGSGYGG